ncbi:ASCH domain protein [Maioricimonas rarisocia]|uniref:ASCH domain protein n=1 Tax=Maioricimonas rarisocia TaxID=2528026 RepID=A0A517ZED8_9PLAN|nr:ASCH domain-containing protein [Maioricimonas rarisocia]QDU40825.1 ASCH domain protein [Maioricimonas rarisocia]
MQHPDHDLIALGIRQPWVELILRGAKTIEVRSTGTRVRGPIYLYASKKPAKIPAARAAARRFDLDWETLPMGQIVGTVEIIDAARCEPHDARSACLPRSLVRDMWGWRLANPVRLSEPLEPRFLPYGVWFYPYRRRNGRPD